MPNETKPETKTPFIPDFHAFTGQLAAMQQQTAAFWTAQTRVAVENWSKLVNDSLAYSSQLVGEARKLSAW